MSRLDSTSVHTLNDLMGHSDCGYGIQTLREHMDGVARRAAAFAHIFGSSAYGAWLGWWHDGGKVADDVQAYLRGETGLERGPDHSSVGMLEAAAHVPYLANIIAGHHSGLDDRVNLRQRILRKQDEERVQRALEQARAYLALEPTVPKAAELNAVVPSFLRQGTRAEQQRKSAFWQRMLHSALVDADRLDTEAHGTPDAAVLREQTSPSMSVLADRLSEAQARLMADAPATPVNAVRRRIYEACVTRADDPPGFFSLTVPTGGGKTRSVMMFALRHAATHALRRVVVALPYTSIIEQNAAVYRNVLGADVVIEHHSNVRAQVDVPQNDERDRRLTLLAENWDAPVVVTTTVQFFESLFARGNTQLRKLHRLAHSVIVLDEAQTLPPPLLLVTLERLRFLVEDYGCTVVFCTATQPAFDATYGRDDQDGYFEGFDLREIAPNPDVLYQQLQRVRYERPDVSWTWDQVAARAKQSAQALMVVNTVDDAHALYDAISDPAALHLSTRLCPAHRQEVLAKVRRRLNGGLPIYLVATQVVEAGVDLSFPLLLRAMGPLESLIQAAGRCNREGEHDEGCVIVYEAAEGKLPPGAYRVATEQTRIMMRTALRRGYDLTTWLHDPSTPKAYFERLYPALNLDERQILALEAQERFREVARQYRLIDETISVVVPYEGAPGDPRTRKREGVLRRIRQHGEVWRTDWRALQPYMVSLRMAAHERAVEEGLCRELVLGLWMWVGQYEGTLGGRGLVWAGALDSNLIA